MKSSGGFERSPHMPGWREAHCLRPVREPVGRLRGCAGQVLAKPERRGLARTRENRRGTGDEEDFLCVTRRSDASPWQCHPEARLGTRRGVPRGRSPSRPCVCPNPCVHWGTIRLRRPLLVGAMVLLCRTSGGRPVKPDYVHSTRARNARVLVLLPEPSRLLPVCLAVPGWLADRGAFRAIPRPPVTGDSAVPPRAGWKWSNLEGETPLGIAVFAPTGRKIPASILHHGAAIRTSSAILLWNFQPVRT